MEEILFREKTEDDIPFIIHSWLSSYYRRSHATTYIQWNLYNAEHSKLIAKILARSKVILCVDREDPKVILGYIVYENDYKNIIHYAYTKLAFQRMKIFTRLLQAAGLFENVYCSHLTHKGRHLQLKHGFIYSPYLGAI